MRRGTCSPLAEFEARRGKGTDFHFSHIRSWTVRRDGRVDNVIGASANQASLAANSIQFGFGAHGVIKANQVAGNQWCIAGDDATGILLYEADPINGEPLTVNVNITQNVFTGNANIGIYVFGNGMTVNNNKVYDDNSIADCGDDIGINNDVTTGFGSNTFTNNKVGGFTLAYSDVTGGKNKCNPNK